MTSSYFSPNLGRPIALGLVEAGLSRIGETVSVYHLGAERRATIMARSRSIRRKAAPCVRWNGRRPAATGGCSSTARLTARRLGGLGQTLISGDLDAAIADARARRADARPLCSRARGCACFAHRPDERAARHALAARRCGRLARRLVRDQRRRRLGRGRSLRRRRAASAHAGDLSRPRSGSPSAAVLVFGLRGLLCGHPPVPRSIWRRRGWRPC